MKKFFKNLKIIIFKWFHRDCPHFCMWCPYKDICDLYENMYNKN